MACTAWWQPKSTASIRTSIDIDGQQLGTKAYQAGEEVIAKGLLTVHLSRVCLYQYRLIHSPLDISVFALPHTERIRVGNERRSCNEQHKATIFLVVGHRNPPCIFIVYKVLSGLSSWAQPSPAQLAGFSILM